MKKCKGMTIAMLRRSPFACVIAISLAVCGLFMAVPVAAEPAFETVAVRDVGPGVQHVTFTPTNNNVSQAIHVLRVARNNPHVSLVAALGRDRVEGTESVLAQAQRLHRPGHTVVGGVNADFFASGPIYGQPIGIHMENKELIVSPNGRPVFGIDAAGVPMINMATLHGEMWRSAPSSASGTSNGVRGASPEALTRARIEEVNRPLAGQELVLYTSRLGSTTPPIDGAFVTLRGITDPVRAGGVHTGIVVGSEVSETPTGLRIRIPQDGVVLATRGPAEVLLSDLSPGEWVHFHLDFFDPLRRMSHAVAGWPILLKDGERLDLDRTDSLVSARHPRTAVGFNDEELFLVTVDGRQPGYSIGMNLTELTSFMLHLGATDALNLDGGGSTTMLVRPPGQFDPVVVNRPSDGRDRAVANALFVVSTASEGMLTRLIPAPAPPPAAAEDAISGQIAPERPLPDTVPWDADVSDVTSILVGSRLPLTALGQDALYGPTGVDPSWVLWSVDGDAGHIERRRSSEGVPVPRFIATSPGTARVHARIGVAWGTLTVHVVDTVARLELEPETIHLSAGDSIALTGRGYDASGRPIRLDAHQLAWSVEKTESPAVSIDGTGTIKALHGGEGVVQARFGDVITSATIHVDRAPVLLSKFDTAGVWIANTARARAALSLEPPPEPPPPQGGPFEAATTAKQAALKLVYDFTVAKGATAAAYVQAVEPLAIPERPTALGVWVYANSNEHWLRANVVDGAGTRHVIDFTTVAGIDWTGWRFLTAPLPQDVPLPMSFERVYVAETHRPRQTPGVLYFDGLQARYNSTP